MLPRDSAAPIKRRTDYRPPAFLVDTLDLEFDLDPAATEVTARLAFRRNPYALASDHAAPLVLDGEQQGDVRVELDGVALPAARLRFGAGSLTVLEPPPAGVLTVRSRNDPARNASLEGLYISSGVFCTQCEPEGFRRITYFPDRPDVLARYTVTHASRSRARSRCCCRTATWSRKARSPTDGTSRRGTIRFPSPRYLFALVAGDLAALEDTFTTHVGPRASRCGSTSTPGNLAALPSTRWRRSKRAIPLGRGALRPRVRPRRFMIVAPTTSTWARWRTRASTSSTPRSCWPTRHRDRRRLRGHRDA